MANETVFPVDPMAAFFAAVTAVENGSVGEIELEFEFGSPSNTVTMSIAVRKEARPMVAFVPRAIGEEEE